MTFLSSTNCFFTAWVVAVFLITCTMYIIYKQDFLHHNTLNHELIYLPPQLNTPEKWNNIRHSSPIDDVMNRVSNSITQPENRLIPGLIIIGAQKSGTTALSYYLNQHPHLLRTVSVEGHFFESQIGPFEKKGFEKRSVLEAARYEYTKQWNTSALESNPALVTYETTPRYMLWSHTIARRVKVICPWTKLIAVLRDPVDRAFSSYTMIKNKGTLRKHNFESCIQSEIDLMTEVGLVKDWNKVNFTEFSGSVDENEAWIKYILQGQRPIKTNLTKRDFSGLNRRTCGYILGRGLYSLQLRHWLEEFPSKDSLLVLKAEDMRSDGVHGPAAYFNQIVSFLGLPESDLQDHEHQHEGQYKEGMNNDTRLMLKKFYAPYNNQLKTLLGDEWNGAWDTK